MDARGVFHGPGSPARTVVPSGRGGRVPTRSGRLPGRTGVAALLGLLAACGAGPGERGEVGVTDSTIVIGSWAPLTGPAAAWGTVGRGMQTYFRMLNEEDGGIHGRRVRFVLHDDQYQPARTVAVVREMVERDGVFALVGGVGTAPILAVKDYLGQHRVPLVGALSGAHQISFPPSDHVFAGLPLYIEEAAVLLDYAVDELGLDRIGIAYQNDDYGRGGLAGARLAAERRGIELAGAVSVELMDTDLSSQALRLRQAGAEAVLLFVTPRHAAILVGEATRIGFRPQWLGSSTLADVELMYEITNGLWRGAIFANNIDPVTSDSPLMERFRAARARYAPEERGGVFFYGGMAIAEMLAEGIRRAGPQPTRAGLIEALAGMEGFDGLTAPIAYGDNPRHGLRAMFLGRCVSAAEVEPLTPWLTADIDVEAAIRRLEGRS